MLAVPTDYAKWNEFLSVWLVDRVQQMTLDGYKKTGDKTTFTHWVIDSVNLTEASAS